MSDVLIRSIRFLLVDYLFLALSCSNVGIKKTAAMASRRERQGRGR